MPKQKKDTEALNPIHYDKREMIQFEKLSEGVYAINYKTKPTYIKYTNEQVMRALEASNVSTLRIMSHYFFNVSGEYRRILHYFSSILTFDYLVIPSSYDDSVDYSKTLDKVLKYTDNANIKEVNRFVALITLLDGIFYGYERTLNENTVLQQLPFEYCRSKFKINNNHAVEFNLRFFDQYKDSEQKIEVFSSFPDEFFEAYLDYKKGNSTEWVMLNPNFARCHKLTDNQTPFFSTIFPELINLTDYKEMDKSKDNMDLYRLIVQKLPLDKNSGLPLLKLEEGQALHRNAKKMISQEGIDVLTTPLDVESVNLQEKGQTLKDNIERANNRVFNTAGISKLLLNSGSDGGSIGLSNSLKVDEALLFSLLDQNKLWYENRFTLINKDRKVYYEILFPPITIFNRKEMYDLYKEGATLGYSKLMPLTAMGIKQTTFMSLIKYENDYLKLLDKMKPLATSYTQTDNAGAGAPKKDDTKLSDKGLKTRNTDANKNRAK
jgi:hypothetical protein